MAVISSALNFEFMLHAATNDIPGFPPADARDAYAALAPGDRDCVDGLLAGTGCEALFRA